MIMLKKTIRLNLVEKETLIRLYLQRKIAIDRYQHRPNDLIDLTNVFNQLTGRSDNPQEILHFMRTKRKAGQWPTLDGHHLRLPTLYGELVDESRIGYLTEAYLEIGVAVDNYGHDVELANKLEERFLQKTGSRVRGILLATVLMELRKDGKLPKVGPRKDEIGFGDMDAAEGM